MGGNFFLPTYRYLYNLGANTQYFRDFKSSRDTVLKRRIRIITINVPLFKKLRDIIFLGGENHFMSDFEGHFEGAKTFLTP
jgi:hypothetical protein